MTMNEFIKKGVSIFGDKYDYHKVKYKNMASQVVIICKEHGEFKQMPSNHIRGRGCLKCSQNKFRSDTKSFVEKAIKVHGDRYNYHKVDYKNNRKKICIICNDHGEFWQNADNHLRLKCGCPICAGHMKLTTKEFIKRSEKIHREEYSYDKTKYERNDIKVVITCKDHGEFLQTPQHHMSGSKCPKCVSNQQMSEEDFINKAIIVHGKEYDYSKVRYKKVKEKVIIICRRHGEFSQKADNHLCGKGCPHCINKSEGKIKNILLKYFKDWIIIPNKKIWDTYKDYYHKRYCDFWLEKDDVKIIVEYDGRQHFEPVCFNGISFKKAERLLKRTQIKDELDKQFCEENNIILHRIRYDADKEESIKGFKTNSNE